MDIWRDVAGADPGRAPGYPSARQEEPEFTGSLCDSISGRLQQQDGAQTVATETSIPQKPLFRMS